ncbi:MAG: GTPase domain-containing protein, partial [Deltaproteobacteria bacterium]|nr:GTPase domain-containing protein [Deltaproteobacteria bacterium]
KEKNLISLKNLQENLSTYKKSIFQIPLVIQYNKRDLEAEGIPLTPVNVLEQTLNSKLKAPSFEASARQGLNVMETLKKIISLTVASLADEIA